ncbi:cilia- and flagella-associated protein 74-like [Belonocnema kinseyi]|uniref:cilia- and flagella-associated protein 74-like n=1 Tax=Belonocnema kinseyi TaxID=2817044 RepID=UPI00143D2C6A|nr:cilia- and flagella-associated protein 74-like [Belonocnema kinseyi]
MDFYEKNKFLGREEFFGEDKENRKKQNEQDSMAENVDNEKWLNLMKTLEEDSGESTVEDPLITEIMRNEKNLHKNDIKEEKRKDKNKEKLNNSIKFSKIEKVEETEGKLPNLGKKASLLAREGEDNFNFLVEDLDSKASRRMSVSEKGKKRKNLDEMSRDTCFYSHPSDVIFKDFEPGKTYFRKVVICNKSSKWAYLRYDRIKWKTHPENLEVEIEKATRLRPGLQVTLTVKFSSEKEEDVKADLIFLTLSPENPEDFHIFRICVLCLPKKPIFLIEPTELRFPTLPIWKYREFGYLKNTLTISNLGSKPFSFRILNEPRGESFFWDIWESGSQNSEYKIIQADDFVLDFHLQADEEIRKKVPDAFPSQKTGSSIELDSRMFENKNENEEMGKFLLELKPKSKFQLMIQFSPKYVGMHRDAVIIDFEKEGKIFKKEVVNIVGEVNGLNISLHPMVIDLGTIVTDSEVYQQNFNVTNSGNTSMAVLLKTPKRLGNQIEVFPKSTIVQPKGSSIISVRLIPKENITNQRLGYFDQTSSILTIPIQIKPSSPEAQNAPPLILKMLATVTTSHALVLKPEFLFLGRVHIQESVISNFYLTNESLIVQDFGFLNLPSYLEIQPNYGFGQILPGETIKLDLIYSPSYNDLQKKDGNSRENQILQIQAMTMAELVGNKILIERVKAGKQLQIVKDFSEEKSEISDHFEDEIPSHFLNLRGSEDSLEAGLNSTIICPEIFNYEERIDDTKNKKNAIEVYVQIVDLFCEFSEQIIEFPATPCGSFSMTSIQLRGFNCSPNENKGKKYSATYEFKTSSEFIQISPQKGFLKSGDIVKVTFLFAPEIPSHLLFKKGSESKAEIIGKEFKKSKEEILKRDKKDTNLMKGKKNLVGKKSQKDEKLEMSSWEEIQEEISPLEYFEPYVFTTIVTCNLKIEEKNSEFRNNEILAAKLYCPVVKPDFLILNNSREFDFGPTAVGTTDRKMLFVKNISNRKLKIDATLLNPFGPFFMPPGKLVEPGSILTLPITFSPEAEGDQVHEFFEIRATGTLTTWRMAVSGNGVVPSWTIEPKILVARLEAKPGQSKELKMKIKNTGECPLTFRMRVLDFLEGPISSPVWQNKEEKTKKGKRTKSCPIKEKFSIRLTEEELEAIYGKKLSLIQNQNVFSFVNFDEKMCLRVQPKKNVDFSIQFHPRKPENEIELSKERKREKKLSGRESKNEVETKMESIYQIGRFNLSLGNLIDVQDIILICRTKQ